MQLPRLRFRVIYIFRGTGTNEGIGYSILKHQNLGQHGLHSSTVFPQTEQIEIVPTNLYQLDDYYGRCNILISFKCRNEKLFYRAVTSILECCIPFIFSSAAGHVCLN